MLPEFASNGVLVTFNGVEIGYLFGSDWGAKVAVLQKITSEESRLVGTGDSVRVVQEYDATAIAPADFSFAFWGPPSFTPDDIGMKATLELDGPGVSLSGEAILMDIRHSGRAGKWSTGSATFQMTGKDEGS